MLDRAWIAAHIPHQRKMCLLNNVVHWDEQSIECEAVSHADLDNPLRAQDRLGISAGIEYAAQAMAVHGALLANEQETPRHGYLTSVRSVIFHTDRLDSLVGEMKVCAQRLSGDSHLILYKFYLTHEAQCLLEGRASVVLNAQAL